MSVTDEILTGEGVLLDARPVGFATRALAAALDVLIYLIVFLLSLAILVNFNASLGSVRTVVIVLLASLTLILPTVVETLTRGYSIGKRAMGIRVVRDDGGPVLFRQAFTRALAGIFELWLTLGVIAFFTSMTHPRGKRVGDILAGTFAIRTRAPRESNVLIIMPPALAAWARTADIPRLPDDMALAARQFLTRAPTMSPQARTQMGHALAAELRRRVAPEPPFSHPEDLIAAVVAERRDREYAKAIAERESIAARVGQVERLPFEVGSHSAR